MSYCIVFENTGDEIPFLPVNQEVLDFYIAHLNQLNLNGFYPVNKKLGQLILLQTNDLKNCIVETNSWLHELAGIKFDVTASEDYLDQHLINKLHAVWVQTQTTGYHIEKKRKELNFSDLAEKIHSIFPDSIQEPPLGSVINKLGFGKNYNSINDPHIHRLENMFTNIKFTVSDTWTKICHNHFPKNILTNNIANINIAFNHLGRTLYNKFVNFDMNLDHNDENSYDELLGYVTVGLQPSQTVPMSVEYIDWCHSHNREPIGDNLNIGNIPNLYENLKKYRIIIFRNLLSNNKFSLVKY
jgi:hypothetical protein